MKDWPNMTGESSMAQSSPASEFAKTENSASKLRVDSSEKDDMVSGSWKIELQWISKALEPAMHLYNWASEPGLSLFSLCLTFFFIFNLFQGRPFISKLLSYIGINALDA